MRRSTAGVAIVILMLAFAISACSRGLYYDLKPGDCVRVTGRGLEWEGAVERIDCSEHDPSPYSRTYVVKASGNRSDVEAVCPQIVGEVVHDGDYAVCYSWSD